MLSQIADPVFKQREMVAMVRLPSAIVEEHLPLEIVPEPAKTVRVAWLLLQHIDPAMKQEAELPGRSSNWAIALTRNAKPRRSVWRTSVGWPSRSWKRPERSPIWKWYFAPSDCLQHSPKPAKQMRKKPQSPVDRQIC